MRRRMTGHRQSEAWNGALGGFEFTIDSISLDRADRRSPHVLLYVKIAGNYWNRPRYEGSSAMTMIVAAALASPHTPAAGLVCDLSELAYPGGDQLLRWRHLPPFREGRGLPFAIVPSEANREKIASLIADEADDT